MASKFRSFRDDPQLRQFYLNGVTATGKSLGVGSYGSVVEIKYEETLCAAKQIHDLLLQAGNEGVHEIIEKYRRECQIMAGLRHPNITQFLGLCVLEGFQLPLLVMERLEMSVDDLLECSPNIPLPVKISILADTSSGLVYLHSRTPPIVHRDLTARNVLLTASLTAKITDFGNSRMVSFRPGQLAQTLTKTPGTTVYMPPEALSESHRYRPSLDVFSFGHLALFTLTQVFPGELLSSTYPNPSNPDQLIARSEVDRRQTYMATLETTCGASHLVLLGLVRQCLHNTPERRPSSQDMLTRLRAMKSKIERVYGGSVAKQLNIASVLYVKEIKEKNKKIRELQVSENKLETNKRELMAVTDRMKTEIRQQQANTQRLELEKEDKQMVLERIEREKRDQQMVLERVEQEKKDQQMVLERVEQEKKDLQTELLRLQQENRDKQRTLDKLKSRLQNQQQLTMAEKGKERAEKVTFSLQLDWRRGPDMPAAVSTFVQSVEINGTVYVGGGWTDRTEGNYIVMACSTQSCQWHSLPSYTTKRFAMTSINSRLVLVGGRARDNSDSRELGKWQPDSNKWTRPFPPMSTPRWNSSATSYKHWLVVAGGRNEVRLNSIEVLDIYNMQWSTRPSTPTPWERMKSTTLGDTWYLMGGYCGGDDYGSPNVYSVSLEALVSQSASDSSNMFKKLFLRQSASEISNIWRKLPSLDCIHSCPLIIRKSVLTVGGQYIKSMNPVSTIQRYDPETDTWVQAGLLPHALWNCTCITTSDKLHFMGGFDGKTINKKLFTSTYN